MKVRMEWVDICLFCFVFQQLSLSYAAQAGLWLSMLLPQILLCWNNRGVPLCLAGLCLCLKKKKRWKEKEKGAKGCSAFGRMLAQDAWSLGLSLLSGFRGRRVIPGQVILSSGEFEGMSQPVCFRCPMGDCLPHPLTMLWYCRRGLTKRWANACIMFLDF